MLATKKAALRKLLGEIQSLQDAHKGKDMPTDVGASIDAKATEAEGLQAEIEQVEAREAKLAGLRSFGEKRLGTEPTVPADDRTEPDASKGSTDGTVGYLTFGDFVAASKGLQDFLAAGRPKGAAFVLADIPSPYSPRGRRRERLVPLNAKMLAEVKAVPTIGANVIEPMRIAEVARDIEQDRLRLRDVLDIGTTQQNAVRYLRSTYTRGAAAVAQGAAKPQAGLSLESLLAAVRKVAVWLPVDDEQLADFSELSRIINNELLYDLDKHVEELVMYGSGTGEEFPGILNDDDVLAMRSEGGDTLIDIARRGITDVRISGFDPNAILAHPLDWEEIVLEKGSDNRYVWVVVTEGDNQRLWGVPVIETVAMSDFQGDETEERNLLVGDFRRGATLWDREQATIQTGWVNEQFIENQRTILAELRAAFAVRRPRAFRKHTTQVAVVS